MVWRIFQSPMLKLPSFNEEEGNFCCNDYNEGLLCIQTDNHDDLISVYQKMFVVRAKEIKMGHAKGGRDSLVQCFYEEKKYYHLREVELRRETL